MVKITKSYYEDHGGVVRERITVKRQEKIYQIGMFLGGFNDVTTHAQNAVSLFIKQNNTHRRSQKPQKTT